MLGHDYMGKRNEILKYIFMSLYNKCGLMNSKKLRSHSAQEVVANMIVENRIKVDIKI